MRNCEKTTEKRRCFFHGGCAALYLHVTVPAGSSPALSHLAALIGQLSLYTERVLLPAAKEALDDAVKGGQGYRFSPHRVHISVTRAPLDRGACFTLTLSLTAGEAPLWKREVVTYWDETEQIQYRRAPRFRRQKQLRAHRP